MSFKDLYNRPAFLAKESVPDDIVVVIPSHGGADAWHPPKPRTPFLEDDALHELTLSIHHAIFPPSKRLRRASRERFDFMLKAMPELRDAALADLEMLVLHGAPRKRALAGSMAADIIGSDTKHWLPRRLRHENELVRSEAWDAARELVVDKPFVPAKLVIPEMNMPTFMAGSLFVLMMDKVPALRTVAPQTAINTNSVLSTQADENWDKKVLTEEPLRPNLMTRAINALRPLGLRR